MDPITELARLLDEAGIEPYINTFYVKNPEVRVKLFRLRANAYLNGRRAAVRHVEFPKK